MDDYRRCAVIAAIFVVAFLLTACTSPLGHRPEVASETGPHDQPHLTPTDAGAPFPERASEPAALSTAPSQEPASRDAYALAFDFRPDDVTYLIVDNEFRDVCGFPPLLTVTTSVKERRSIVQHVLEPVPHEKTISPRNNLPRISWECDRYEVCEHGLKEETSFDSLRDLYPPPGLWQLGGIPGSVCTFLVDPRTGKASQFRLRPAQVSGGGGSAKLSKTAERCALTDENLQKLLDDLGPFYFPDSPKRIGEQWTRTFQEDQKAIGVVTTRLACTLRSVREHDGRQIAMITLSGEISLQIKPEHANEDATSKPAPRPKTTQSSQQHYILDKADCSGLIEFDLTRGEPVQIKLHRELEFFAPIEANGQSSMVKEIRSGWAQDLRVTVSHTPPPKPVIVGGPKPPVVPPGSKTTTGPTTQPSRATGRPAAPRGGRPPATQPTTSPSRSHGTSPAHLSRPAAASRPASKRQVQRATSAPAVPATTRPASHDRHRPR